MFPANPGANIDDPSASSDNLEPEETKWFFKPAQAKLSVKGSLLPLSAKPTFLDLGDWLAHVTVDQYRALELNVNLIQEVNGKAAVPAPICNPTCCPTMSAGRHYTYTWLNNDRTPIRVPACQYIALVQRWVVGKIQDPVAFPTQDPFATSSSFETAYPNNSGFGPVGENPIPMGPSTLNRTLSDLTGRNWVGKSAGFPESFMGDVRTAWRQMFRIYAHLYHSHFMDPFWHINKTAHMDLNAAFCYFISLGKLFGLFSDRDLEPMQELIDIWIANGSIHEDCALGKSAITQ
ncbi:MAG: hypothetical protein Q9183_000287 [Haloplaca sp. 2 TL-2023]